MKLRFPTANTSSHHQRGFTLLELFVVVAFIAVILTMFSPCVSTSTKAKAVRIKCSSNLKQMALAFKMYAGDHNELFPWETMEGKAPRTQNQQVWQYMLTVSNELGSTKLLMCPGDITRQPNSANDFSAGPYGLANPAKQDAAISYFLGLSASSNRPNAILAGDRNLAMNDAGRLYGSRGGNLYEIPLKSVWNAQPDQAHHDKAGNYILADCSVQQASTERLQDALRLARDSYGTNANHFLFPQ